MTRKKRESIELPFSMPWFITYHQHAGPGVVAKNNPTADNWFFNKAIQLYSKTDNLFATSGASAKVSIYGGFSGEIPFLEKHWTQTRFLRNCVNEVIQSMLENGYYVLFHGVDDYYVKGKSWYKEKHFGHDGLICGVDNETKEYIIAAYDKQWIYRTFKTPQRGFAAGVRAIIDENRNGGLMSIKCLPYKVELNVSEIKQELLLYLNSALEPNEQGEVFGVAVTPYVIEYINRLKTGEIPYEKIDKRIAPKLPFDYADVLVVDQTGKDVSGTGMDTKVVGRILKPLLSKEPDSPKIKRLIALGLTEHASGGPGMVGMLDFAS